MTIYVLDTNVISDLVAPLPRPSVLAKLALVQHDTLCLCEAVEYEVRRGYLKTNATSKIKTFEERVKTQLKLTPLIEADWRQAAQLWADATNHGHVLSDVDLLVAAIAIRLDGIVVSADNDFDVLPVKRENWRNP
jgi:predicted nucleic acid-binding protein